MTDHVYVCPLCNMASELWETMVEHFDSMHSKDCLNKMIPDGRNHTNASKGSK